MFKACSCFQVNPSQQLPPIVSITTRPCWTLSRLPVQSFYNAPHYFNQIHMFKKTHALTRPDYLLKNIDIILRSTANTMDKVHVIALRKLEASLQHLCIVFATQLQSWHSKSLWSQSLTGWDIVPIPIRSDCQNCKWIWKCNKRSCIINLLDINLLKHRDFLIESVTEICRKLLGGTDACSYFTGSVYTVVMVADPGTFSGTPEAVHFEESLKNPVYLPSGSMLCPRVTVGELLGRPTIVATSGECLHRYLACLCAITFAFAKRLSLHSCNLPWIETGSQIRIALFIHLYSTHNHKMIELLYYVTMVYSPNSVECT